MNDLLRTRFFILLADTSQEVINTEMQDAYENFVKQIVTISNSEDYTHIFRMLNLTRIEIAPLKGCQISVIINKLNATSWNKIGILHL